MHFDSKDRHKQEPHLSLKILKFHILEKYRYLHRVIAELIRMYESRRSVISVVNPDMALGLPNNNTATNLKNLSNNLKFCIICVKVHLLS